MRILRDLNRPAFGRFGKYRYSDTRVEIKVRAFKHFEVSSWGRDTLNTTSEIGGYTLREGIS